MAMDLDLQKERELDDLHTQIRHIENEKAELKKKLTHLEQQEAKIKERINSMNDDAYVERKLQLLYDQKHEKKSGR